MRIKSQKIKDPIIRESVDKLVKKLTNPEQLLKEKERSEKWLK